VTSWLDNIQTAINGANAAQSIGTVIGWLLTIILILMAACFVWVILDPQRWEGRWLPMIRGWLKQTKTVATELDAKVDARLNAQDAKLDAILEIIKPKV
jgi:hypothetical protein